MSVAQGNVGAAFGVAFGAGMSTTIGAAFPFFRQVKSSDKRLLAGALALSGGVMIFVSFCEILQVKAVDSFAEAACSGDDASDTCIEDSYGYAVTSSYGTFFAGIILTKLIDMLVHRLTGEDEDEVLDEIFEEAEKIEKAEKGEEMRSGVSVLAGNDEDRVRQGGSEDSLYDAEDAELESGDTASVVSDDDDSSDNVTKGEHGPMEIEDPATPIKKKVSAHEKALQKMSLMAGIALALHNFPEGLATFAATLTDTSVGASLGVAIAIHNIPEGVVVAMPVYYATGSKWKAWFWGTMSGLAEPLGALLGYVVLVNSFDAIIYGVLFALVAGMMVYIVIGELLPTALRYDNKGTVVVPSFFIGAFVMAVSLIAFQV